MIKKKTVYTVVADRNLMSFIAIVNERLDEGWVCKGGMATDGQDHYQSLIKYIEAPKVLQNTTIPKNLKKK